MCGPVGVLTVGGQWVVDFLDSLVSSLLSVQFCNYLLFLVYTVTTYDIVSEYF